MLRDYLPLSKLVNIYDELDAALNYPFPINDDDIFLEVPGFTKTDLSVDVDKKTCTISIKGEKEIYGFKRSINKTIRDYRLANIDLSTIEAKVEDGILSIHLNTLKPQEKENKKTIIIK